VEANYSPTPDVAGSIAMSATSGKVALISHATVLTCGAACATDPAVVDFVGYGAANNWEGAGAAPSPSNTTVALRNGGGCVDTKRGRNEFVNRDKIDVDAVTGVKGRRTHKKPKHSATEL
jgi:hypothetical protein